MPYQRILYQISILGLCSLALFLAAFGAEAACRAIWLPGETLWTLRHLAGQAVAQMVGSADPGASYCLAGGTAEIISTLTVYMLPVLLVVLAAQILYETVRHSLHRRYCIGRGGHALILGDADDIGSLVAREQSAGRTLLISRDAAGENALRQRYWNMPVVPSDVGAAGLGLSRARLVAAVSGSDVANLNLIDDVQDQAPAPGGRIVLRLESPVLRAAQASRHGRFHEEISLDQGMFRRGAMAGDPGQRFAGGEHAAHIVLIGGDPGLGDLAVHLATFGYGLEHAVPRLTILGTAGADRSAAIERLRATPYVVQIVTAACDAADPVGLERALVSILSSHPVPCAIHCIGGVPGEAVAIAMLAATTARALVNAAPAIIAYGRAGAPAPRGAQSAGISYIACDDLATAIAAQGRRDQMARAVHTAYLALQRRTRGAAFGTLAAECEWSDLPIAFRDDNRAVADHIDHMIRAVGLMRRPATGRAEMLSPDQIERMAAMAHARWLAGKVLAGWHFGHARDDAARLHPGILPYAELSETEKDKDRDQIRAIPHILAILGEELACHSDDGSSPGIS